MPGLRFIPLGIGDAFSARHYSTCLALEAEGAWLLLECPHPIRKMWAEGMAAAGLQLELDRVVGVAVSHLHADHSSGLEGLGYLSHFFLKRRARLLMHPDVSARLWDGHLAAGMECLMLKAGEPSVARTLADYFELVPLASDQAVTIGPFAVECRFTIHHIPTTAFRVSAGGRSLSYSADTCFDPDLIGWLAEADLVIHETNLGVHTPYEKLAALPAALRAKMRLIHYLDDFPVENSAIEPLQQGQLYQV